MPKCKCESCKTSTLLDRNEEAAIRAKNNSFFYGFLNKIGLAHIPAPPPFKIGDKVEYIHELEGVYDCYKGETYSIYSQGLSRDKKFWFVRLNEKPSSAPAEYFRLIKS